MPAGTMSPVNFNATDTRLPRPQPTAEQLQYNPVVLPPLGPGPSPPAEESGQLSLAAQNQTLGPRVSAGLGGLAGGLAGFGLGSVIGDRAFAAGTAAGFAGFVAIVTAPISAPVLIGLGVAVVVGVVLAELVADPNKTDSDNVSAGFGPAFEFGVGIGAIAKLTSLKNEAPPPPSSGTEELEDTGPQDPDNPYRRRDSSREVMIADRLIAATEKSALSRH